MQGKKSYQEKLFISFQLSDYIPADNFYRRLNDTLDLDFVLQGNCQILWQGGPEKLRSSCIHENDAGRLS